MIEKLKDKYEILIGFIAIIISLSVFKDELKLIVIDLGFINFDLSQYLFIILICILFSIYLYTIERVLSKTKLGNWKGFNAVIIIAYTIFILILFSPFIIAVFYFIYLFISSILKFKAITITVLSSIISLVFSIVTAFLSGKYIRLQLIARKSKAIERNELEEINNLNTANKLFSHGYYSQSIIVAFNVLELHFYKMISKNDLSVRRYDFQDLFKRAIKLGAVENQDISLVKEIREMRNKAAHNVEKLSKEDAKKSINFITQLIK